MRRGSNNFWNCCACGAQNSRLDGDCQFCACGGATCKRDNCDDPAHGVGPESPPYDPDWDRAMAPADERDVDEDESATGARYRITYAGALDATLRARGDLHDYESLGEAISAVQTISIRAGYVDMDCDDGVRLYHDVEACIADTDGSNPTAKIERVHTSIANGGGQT